MGSSPGATREKIEQSGSGGGGREQASGVASGDDDNAERIDGNAEGKKSMKAKAEAEADLENRAAEEVKLKTVQNATRA